MLATEDMLAPMLRKIDSMYYREHLLKSDEAEDIVKFVSWIIGESLTETNIQHVVANLHSYKNVVDSHIMSALIKQFIQICGSNM